MRWKRIVGVIGLCLGASGCQLASDITRNAVFETYLCANDIKSKVYYPCVARSAWKEYQGCHPDLSDSKDFAKGFRLGYADYLEYGDGPSRQVPPIRYWKLRNETAEGRAASERWMAGFRAGAEAAKASGQRELIVVPVGDRGSVPPVPSPAPPTGPPLGEPLPTPQGPIAPPIPQGPTSPPLPQGLTPPPVPELPHPRSVSSLPYWQTSWQGQAAVPVAPTPPSSPGLEPKGPILAQEDNSARFHLYSDENCVRQTTVRGFWRPAD